MPSSRFGFSIDERRRTRLKSFAEAQGVSAATVLKTVIDRLPGIPAESAEARRPGSSASQVNVRLTAKEDALLDEHVDKTDFDSRTSWATRVLVQAINGSPVMTHAEVMELRQSRSELAAIGRNLNQIAKALNTDPTSEKPSETLILKVLEVVDAHNDALAALIRKVLNRGRQ